MKTLAALLAALSLAAPAARADVLIVDELLGPGAAYTQISAAVADAASGDTILVRGGGSYISFAVDGKSLVITAEEGEVVFLLGSMVVRNIAPDQSVVLRGLRAQSVSSGVGLLVEDCAGPVWIEDCQLTEPYLTQTPVHGIEIHDSAFVTLQRCSPMGSRAQGLNTEGGLGLLATGSDVAVFDSDIRGGTGLASLGTMIDAGDGARVVGGRFFVSGGTILGGDGGNGSGPFGCTDGGDGGTGLVLDGAQPQARVLGTTVSGGAAGSTRDTCTPGTAGQDVELLAGSLDDMAHTARTLSIASPLRAGDTLTAQLGGDPGDFVWALLSPTYAPVLLPNGSPFVGGPLLTDLVAGQVIVIGALDPTGALQLDLPVPPLPVTFTRYVQALVFSATPGGEIVLSSATAVTFLEDGTL